MLIFMRHGQASFGTPHYDRLSSLGTEQASATGAFLRERELQCNKVYVGPRDRHHATASFLIDSWGTEVLQCDAPELDEFTGSRNMSVTTLVQPDITLDERLEQLMHRIGAWADGDLELEGAPTLSEFRQRVGDWTHQKLAEVEHETVVVAVTSAGVVAAALCEVMDLPNSMFLSVVSQVYNASLTEISVSRGQPVVVSFNGHAHLNKQLLSVI